MLRVRRGSRRRRGLVIWRRRRQGRVRGRRRHAPTHQHARKLSYEAASSLTLNFTSSSSPPVVATPLAAGALMPAPLEAGPILHTPPGRPASDKVRQPGFARAACSARCFHGRLGKTADPRAATCDITFPRGVGLACSSTALGNAPLQRLGLRAREGCTACTASAGLAARGTAWYAVVHRICQAVLLRTLARPLLSCCRPARRGDASRASPARAGGRLSDCGGCGCGVGWREGQRQQQHPALSVR